jgi:hypothetical protein
MAARHTIGLACGIALGAVSAIDFYTARSLSLVAYVQPHVVGLVQWLDAGLSTICALGVAAVIVSWPFIVREAHRRITLGVAALETAGLTLDVMALLASTLFGKQAKPLYLLLEAGLVQLSTVLLFATWYAAIDHHRVGAADDGAPQRLGFPQQSAHYPGYEGWSPRFVDYLTFAFTTSAGLGPSEAMPLAVLAKLLVCLQVTLSLVILLVLAARAIGLIT